MRPAWSRVIRDSASRMSALIDNLLDLARGRVSGLALQRYSDQPVEAVLREVIAELNASLPDRVVETTFALVDPVNCDRSRLAQLFSNILSNALTYGFADRPVRVRASSSAGTFELSVANAGDPIPPAALEHLFQPFYRRAVIQNRDGLGLGLYIAHEIAMAHGGTLAVTSTQEETIFIFRMPTG